VIREWLAIRYVIPGPAAAPPQTEPGIGFVVAVIQTGSGFPLRAGPE
jgi:hypothetical protein